MAYKKTKKMSKGMMVKKTKKMSKGGRTKMMNGGTVITLKNGRKALTGQCVKCGTKMFKFIAS